MKFEDIEHYMHEEHLQNEAAKFIADLMHSQEARRALHRARLQRAVAACFLLGVITLTSSAFMPTPKQPHQYVTAFNKYIPCYETHYLRLVVFSNAVCRRCGDG